MNVCFFKGMNHHGSQLFNANFPILISIIKIKGLLGFFEIFDISFKKTSNYVLLVIVSNKESDDVFLKVFVINSLVVILVITIKNFKVSLNITFTWRKCFIDCFVSIFHHNLSAIGINKVLTMRVLLKYVTSKSLSVFKVYKWSLSEVIIHIDFVKIF